METITQNFSRSCQLLPKLIGDRFYETWGQDELSHFGRNLWGRDAVLTKFSIRTKPKGSAWANDIISEEVIVEENANIVCDPLEEEIRKALFPISTDSSLG